jgi:hypothetical protein
MGINGRIYSPASYAAASARAASGGRFVPATRAGGSEPVGGAKVWKLAARDAAQDVGRLLRTCMASLVPLPNRARQTWVFSMR